MCLYKQFWWLCVCLLHYICELFSALYNHKYYYQFSRGGTFLFSKSFLISFFSLRVQSSKNLLLCISSPMEIKVKVSTRVDLLIRSKVQMLI